MHKNLKSIASGVLVGALTAVTVIPALVVRADTSTALSYISSKPMSAWSIMALAAAGQAPSDLSAVTSVSSNKAIDYEAPILAIAAAQHDPRTYPATDYVAKLKTFWDNTQLGDATTLNDDIFGALALSSAGVAASDPVLVGLKSYIPARQNADGGYPFSIGGASDTDTTSAAIMALIELGVPASDQSITKAVAYLKGAQNDDGGFPYDPKSQWGTDSDADSDTWVIMAINKLGDSVSSWEKNSKTPVDHLLSLQDAAGYFHWQPAAAETGYTAVTTADAIIALSGKAFPVAKFTAPVGTHIFYRLAGSTQDYCSGEAYATNPLQLVKDIATTCGITYHVTHYSFGDYLDTIGSDVSSGTAGWQYVVNNTVPSVGADSFVLHANDSVLWYFANFDAKLTKISVSGATVASGASFTATVQSLEGSSWQPLAGATVHYGNSMMNTGTDGTATITLPDGAYRLYATKDGYVRSDAVSVTVGAAGQSAVDLTVDLGGGSGSGSAGSQVGTISFSVAPTDGSSAVDFGHIVRGQTTTQPIRIANTSGNAIHVEALASGDKVFTTYLTVGGSPWRKFNDKIDGNGSKQIDIGLTVPNEYPEGGVKSGRLTLWASIAQ